MKWIVTDILLFYVVILYSYANPVIGSLLGFQCHGDRTEKQFLRFGSYAGAGESETSTNGLKISNTLTSNVLYPFTKSLMLILK